MYIKRHLGCINLKVELPMILEVDNKGVDVINNFQCRRLDLSHGVKAILSEEAEGTGSDAS